MFIGDEKSIHCQNPNRKTLCRDPEESSTSEIKLNVQDWANCHPLINGKMDNLTRIQNEEYYSSIEKHSFGA